MMMIMQYVKYEPGSWDQIAIMYVNFSRTGFFMLLQKLFEPIRNAATIIVLRCLTVCHSSLFSHFLSVTFLFRLTNWMNHDICYVSTHSCVTMGWLLCLVTDWRRPTGGGPIGGKKGILNMRSPQPEKVMGPRMVALCLWVWNTISKDWIHVC